MPITLELCCSVQLVLILAQPHGPWRSSEIVREDSSILILRVRKDHSFYPKVRSWGRLWSYTENLIPVKTVLKVPSKFYVLKF